MTVLLGTAREVAAARCVAFARASARFETFSRHQVFRAEARARFPGMGKRRGKGTLGGRDASYRLANTRLPAILEPFSNRKIRV
jgi:hypothetical protein